jgi:hypothetical protein
VARKAKKSAKKKGAKAPEKIPWHDGIGNERCARVLGRSGFNRVKRGIPMASLGGACIPPRPSAPYEFGIHRARERPVNNLIYLIGLIVVVLAILSFFGLR